MTYLMNQIQNLIQISKKSADYEPYFEVLESIRFDGTKMFWLPVKPALDVKIDITFKSDNYASTSCLLGGRINASGSNRKMFAFWQCVGGSSARPDDGYMRADLSNSSTGTGDIGKSNSTSVWTNIVKDGIYNYLNGELKATQSSVADEFYDDTNTYIALGCMSNGTESSYTLSNPFSGDVAQLKIWKAGTQVADYIPVLDSKMQPCLYNRITKEFLYAKVYPSGSTTTYDLGFKRWNKYEVDYIESSGTQYINTGYVFADDFAYEVEYEGLNNGECLLGGRTSSVRTAILYRAMATQVDGQTTVPIAGLNATQTPFKLGVLSDTKHKVKVAIANNKGNVWLDDTQIYTDQSFTGTYISGKTTAIFADHFGDQTGTSEYQEYATSKLYALKFWQGTTLVRDYKPSVRTYNDGTAVVTKAFMYDEVYNKAYYNAGTGSFKAYIAPDREVYNLSMHNTMDTDGFYLAEDGTRTVSSDGTSCYTEAIQVKEGDIIEWTVTAEAVTANKRIHGYSTNADITTGQKGSWVEMLAKIVFSTTSETTQKASFVVPNGVNYIRLSLVFA